MNGWKIKAALTHFEVESEIHEGLLKAMGPQPTFGFRSGRDIDKLSKMGFKEGITGCPLITELKLTALGLATGSN